MNNNEPHVEGGTEECAEFDNEHEMHDCMTECATVPRLLETHQTAYWCRFKEPRKDQVYIISYSKLSSIFINRITLLPTLTNRRVILPSLNPNSGGLQDVA